jgi:Cytochrome c bacterial
VGAEETGLSLPEGYSFVDTQRYMGILHEMPPADQVLECAECHDSTDRVDFSALGYDPVDQRNGEPLCSSCHEPEESMNFYQLHDKHVKDKDISCDTCHTFTRE